MEWTFWRHKIKKSLLLLIIYIKKKIKRVILYITQSCWTWIFPITMKERKIHLSPIIYTTIELACCVGKDSHSPIGLAADFFKKQCVFVDCCHKLSNVPTPRVCNCTLKNHQELKYLRSLPLIWQFPCNLLLYLMLYLTNISVCM